RWGWACGRGLGRGPLGRGGALLVHGGRAVAWLAGTGTLLGAMFGHWRNRLDRAAERLRLRLAEQRAIDSAERWLRRWPAATLLLLAASGALALLVRPL
ncbi:hypothetical protein, partial [Thiohalocapsa sp.]|uniref:hypothetical protein n=1 Tax=Thiohalocapsa sp. TaxID=2497641 RepID=UPI0025FAFC17